MNKFIIVPIEDIIKNSNIFINKENKALLVSGNELFTKDEINLFIEQISESSEENADFFSKLAIETMNPEYLHTGRIEAYIEDKITILKGSEKVFAAYLNNEKNVVLNISQQNVEQFPKLAHDYKIYDNFQEVDFSFTVYPPEDSGIELLPNEINIEYTNFVINEHSPWKNKNYIKQEIKNGNLKISHLLSEDLLNDKDFIIELIKIDYEIIDIWYKPCTIEWAEILIKWFERDSSDFMEYFVSREEDIVKLLDEKVSHNYRINNSIDNAEENNKISVLLDTILSHEGIASYILQNENYNKYVRDNSLKIISNFSANILAKEENFSYILPYMTYELLQKLPSRYFSEKDKLLKIMKSLGDRCEYLDIVEIKNFFQDNEYSYKSWISDKATVYGVLDVLNKTTSARSVDLLSYVLFPLIKPHFYQDIEVLKKSILIDPNIYLQFPEKMKSEASLLKHYLTYGQLSKGQINKEFLFKQTDIRTIKNILFYQGELIFDQNCPWKDNVELYKNSDFFIKHFQLIPEKIKEKIYNDKKFILSLINNFYIKRKLDVYANLPKTLQEEEEIALQYACCPNSDKNLLPKKLLHNINFCIKCIERESTFFKTLPKLFKNDVNFVVKILKNYYNCGSISEADSKYRGIKDYLPEIFQMVEGLNVEYNKGYQFIIEHLANQKKYELYHHLNNEKQLSYSKKNKI